MLAVVDFPIFKSNVGVFAGYFGGRPFGNAGVPTLSLTAVSKIKAVKSRSEKKHQTSQSQN